MRAFRATQGPGRRRPDARRDGEGGARSFGDRGAGAPQRKEAPDARSASATNLVLGVAPCGVRQNRGLGRTRRGLGGVAVALVIAGDDWKLALLRDGFGEYAEALGPRARRA